MSDRFKCRFCSYTVLKFRNVKGKTVSGWPRMFEHVEINHEDEARKMKPDCALGVDDGKS